MSFQSRKGVLHASFVICCCYELSDTLLCGVWRQCFPLECGATFTVSFSGFFSCYSVVSFLNWLLPESMSSSWQWRIFCWLLTKMCYDINLGYENTSWNVIFMINKLIEWEFLILTQKEYNVSFNRSSNWQSILEIFGIYDISSLDVNLRLNWALNVGIPWPYSVPWHQSFHLRKKWKLLH